VRQTICKRCPTDFGGGATAPSPPKSWRLSDVPWPPSYTPWATSSSAVAERPRDALCPSVVSVNSVIHGTQSFIIVT